ncbi:MAG: hypothetical protein BWK76_05825 [Desulfobulbaceae bacterium A2]|nr:MAG: hypothetical protein BWK76_05825 [Desulfobulbaceae bacterium A2]
MQQDGELVRLEQVVSKLLESHQALQRRCQDLETALREREQACGELQQQINQLNSERSQVANRVQNLLGRIDRWQEDNNQARTAGHDDGGQGTLFALPS